MTPSSDASSIDRRSSGVACDRAELAARYRRGRARSRALFDLIDDAAYYARPISLRLPVVFYEGHLPMFSFNTLVKTALGRPSIDPRLERLFARGIDPRESGAGGESGRESMWPRRAEVKELAAEADRQVLEALEHGDIERPGHPLLDRAEAAFCILEHEAMHQETLLYMWHQLPYESKRAPAGYRPRSQGVTPVQSLVDVPAGKAVLGVQPTEEEFTWDNERPHHSVNVGAFRMDRHNVTNEHFMEFVTAGGYRDGRWWQPEDQAWLRATATTHPPFWAFENGRWWWKGLFGLIELPPSWPAYVSQAEASAFARWRDVRLPTEAEYQRAAFGSPEEKPRRYPWGDEAPAARHGVFDFSSFDPDPAGSHPEGGSAWGIEDLMGNGWEWTSTVFAPFPDFEPMPSYPEYSADFFDGEHFVMKGGSPATARELLRPSFRNWFRSRYPYVYASFRCVDDASESRRSR